MKTFAAAPTKVSPKQRAPVACRRAWRPAALDHGRASLTPAPLSVQASLTVGAADDPLEKEADATADRVVSMPAPAPAPAATPPGEDDTPQASRAVRREGGEQPNLDELVDPELPANLQDVEVPAAEDVDAGKLDSSDMSEVEAGAPADADEPPAEDPPPVDLGEQFLMPSRDDCAAAGPQGGAAPPEVAARVAQPGAGRPLPAGVRGYMEPRFGADFSEVRVHDAPEDRAAARRIGARAFTHGRHVWLGPGESVENRRLMAHELTHVVQQTGRGEPARREPVARETEAPIRRGWLRNKAERIARHIPGYTLICVIVGKSLITGNAVPRTAENFIGGFLGLIPGGTAIFDKLKESGALQEAMDWVSNRLTELDITWARVSRILDNIWDAAISWHPIDNLTELFAPLVRDIKTFVGDIKDKILEFILYGALKLLGPYGERVMGVIQKAGETLSLIFRDPLGFAWNLIKSVIKGFSLFSDHIWDHLKKGMMAWLFGTMQGAGITLPDKLDLKGLLDIGLQVVGLVYDRIREKFVKALDPGGERKVGYLEKGVEVLRTLVKEGIMGVWQKILGMIEGFKTTIIEGIRNWITVQIVQAGVTWLASLTNPIGGILRIALAIYDMIKVFLERWDQIVAVASAMFDAMGAIARGQIDAAATHVENTLAKAIPVILAFIAGFLRLTGISKAIRDIIDKIRKPVDAALTRMIKFLVDKAKKLLAKVIGKLNSARKLPSAEFKVGPVTHRIFAEKKGKKIVTMIASGDATEADQVSKNTAEQASKVEDPKDAKAVASLSEGVQQADKKSDDAAGKVNLDSQNTNQQKPVENLKKTIEDGAAKLTETAKVIETSDHLCPVSEKGVLLRACEPRDPELEGKVATHAELKKDTEQTLKGGVPKSTYFEADHIIEKVFPKAILENLKNLVKKQTAQNLKVFRTSDREAKATRVTVAEAQPGGKPFGELGGPTRQKIDEAGGTLPAMIIYKGTHKGKTELTAKAGAGKGAGEDWVAQAAQAPDPHQFLRDKIKEQLKTELSIIAELYGKDHAAIQKAILPKINKGMTAVQDLNLPIYGLGQMAAPDPAMEAAKTEAANAVELKNDGKRPLEGQGGPYNTLPTEGNLERDHIVDEAYPKALKSVTFGEAKFIEPALTQAKATAKIPASTLSGRKKKLSDQKLYPSGKIAAYDRPTGYAVALYAPVHRKATSALPGGAPDILPTPSYAGLAALAEFLRTGEDSSLEVGRAAFSAQAEAVVYKRAVDHADMVSGAYAGEVDQVVKMNPGNEEAARKAMDAVVAQVQASLATAKSETQALFT